MNKNYYNYNKFKMYINFISEFQTFIHMMIINLMVN